MATDNLSNISSASVLNWSIEDTKIWLQTEGFNKDTIKFLCDDNELNGKCLLALNEKDFTILPLNQLTLRDRKCLYISCKLLQRDNQALLIELGLVEHPQPPSSIATFSQQLNNRPNEYYTNSEYYCEEQQRITPPISEDGTRVPRLPPEKTKAFLSFCYVVVVTWITAFVMVIVHDRVPDMKKYPPLPDIFLDNVPHIPWAFDMCEVTGTFLFTIWLIVLVFHKHRLEKNYEIYI